MLYRFIKLLFMILFISSAPAWAADDLSNIENQIKKLEKQAKSIRQAESDLKAALHELGQMRSQLAELLENQNTLIKKATKDLESLGEKVEKETVEVTKKRKELSGIKAEYEKQGSSIRLLALRVEDTHKIYTERLSALLKTKLLAKTPDMVKLLQKGLAQPGHWIDGIKKVILQPTGIQKEKSSSFVYILIVAALILFISVMGRKKLLPLINRHKWGEYFSDHIACALTVTLTRWLPYLSTTIVLAIGIYLISDKQQVTTSYYLLLVYALPVLFCSIATIEFLLNPHPPAKRFIVEDEKLAISMAYRLRLFVLMLFIAFILFSSSMLDVLSKEMFYFARGVFAIFFVTILVSLSRITVKIPYLKKFAWLRLLFIVAIIVGLFSELSGYRNLSTAIFRVSIGTLVLLGILIFLLTLFSDIYDGINTGTKNWQKSLRNIMGAHHGVRMGWLPWMRFLSALVLWLGVFYLLLHVVNLSEATMQQIFLVLQQGFQLGSLKVIPERIFWAFVAFSLLYLLSNWIKARIAVYLSSRSRYLERGAREATLTMFGYTGVAIAIIVALGIAGATFTNLAIIAGALSVGIGFGLQNIVNNFVSGLILLFERPIKTGDWIVVGNTEGYVKKISIRSTQIQTFDRSDVIVPNSDLISNQVTNWMLYDQSGRVRVPVGVAYGTDTSQVREILTGVAEQHQDVIHNNDNYKIRVLFLAFGDSSLNFELRCYIRNVDHRLQVLSDLNFAIDQAFRENGIEIPYPQRDIHIKDGSHRLPPEDTK